LTDQDQDLERQLRSERGPREEGYSPTPLPMTLDANPAAGRGPSRALRTGMFVGVAAAAALAVVVVGGFLAGPSPDTSGSGSASPGIGACDPSDVALTAEAWGGAAGSRGTVLTIALVQGRAACTLPASVLVQIEDANGTALVGNGSVLAGGPVLLEAGATYSSGAAWSNWCGGDPALPVTLAVKFGDWPSWAPVNVPVNGLSPVPPCSGTGPSVLSLSGFELQP
jgi:hypothetical protein